MSGFLNRLKQQQAAQRPEQGLRLLYGLRLVPVPSGWPSPALQLAVARLQEGRWIDDHQSYALQPHHLAQPPGFFTALDLELLRALFQADPAWQGRSEGELPSLPAHWWQRLLESGRAHAVLDNGRPGLPLQWGPILATHPHWRVDATGCQQLDWQLPDALHGVTGSRWCYWQPDLQRLGALDCAVTAAAEDWLQRRPPLMPEDVGDFLAREGAALTDAGLPLPAVFTLHVRQPQPQLRLRFCGELAASARVDVEVLYRQDDLDWALPLDAVTDRFSTLRQGEVWLLQRDRDAESRLIQRLQQPLPPEHTLAGSTLRLTQPAHWRDLILEQVPPWQALGWQIEIAAGFAFHFVAVGRYQARLETLPGWFDLGLGIEVAGETVDLMPLLQQAAQRHSLTALQRMPADSLLDLSLPDGRLVSLPVGRVVNWLLVLVEAANPGAPERTLRLPWSQQTRLAQLEQAAGEQPLYWQGDTATLGDARALLQQTFSAHVTLPPGFRAQLRDYQARGVLWLQHLAARGCGGILADDMGLGKTVQALAHIAIEHHEGRLQLGALIVVPTSLLANWQREAAQFLPALRCTILHGPQRQRRLPRAGKGGLYVTTYAALVNDLPHWRQRPLDLMILDEAQAIKNAATQASQAVRQVEARQKLCLSGTPLENHLGELWSLVDFVMPDFLGPETLFQRQYRTPVEKQQDQAHLQGLLQRIGPLMLRRRKDEVATELPPKTETLVLLDLQEQQRDLYETLRIQALGQLQPLLADGGGAQIQILNALSRLRQLCCDPSLVQAEGEAPLPSAKRQHCLQMIEELASEGRSILLFSQFTRMLDLLAADLQASGIPSLMLTGRSRNRGELVRRFQAGEAPVFLISLKAGGTGLNLTRADTVIHYDPWWNTAAEQQATDRAYRIGQDKPVFVYKLLTRDTVEERILSLQRSKQSLLEAVYQVAEQTGQELAWDAHSLLQLLQPTPEE